MGVASSQRSRPLRAAPDTLRLFDDLDNPDWVEPTPSRAADGRGDDHRPTQSEQFRIEVRRSKKRKRTVGAHLTGDLLTIVIPAWMNADEEAHWVDVMSGRFRRQRSAERIDLAARAAALARRHDLPAPDEIRWSDDMRSRWGSCTPATRTIRVSTHVAKFPDWVVDYVIVHELAHLVVAGHSRPFWKLVHRYDKAERAIGYLIAKAGDDHE